MSSWYVLHRPQTVKELDQEAVRNVVLSFIKRGRFPHALLFSGPKGSGKTSAARIVAKILNCERYKSGKKKFGEPCNKCTHCREIVLGNSMAVIELDAASHRGIEDVRQIRDSVKLVAPGNQTKVYIIDEAHMLTLEAANALLKTLEEPPPNVVFILATTEPHKIPETVKSRTSPVSFARATKGEILRSLRRVVERESLKVEDGVLEMIADASEGSFRDSIKILEQISGRGMIKKEGVESFLLTKLTDPQKLIKLLAKKDTKGALGEIARVSKRVNMRQFTFGLIEMLHSQLLSNLGVGDPVREKIDFSLDELRKLIKLIVWSVEEMRASPIAELPLELAIVEWCKKETIDQHNAKTEIEENKLPRSKSSTLSSDEAPRGILQAGRQTSQPRSTVAEKFVSSPAPYGAGLRSITAQNKKIKDKKKPQYSTNKTVSIPEDFWEKFIAQLKAKNHTIAALLRSAKPIGLEGNNLTVNVFYQFHKERLDEKKNLAVVEEVAQDVLGQKVKVNFVLGERPREVPDKPRRAGSRFTGQEGTDEDLIKTAEEIFKGKFTN